MNRAEPGFTLDAKVATFRENFASDRPAVVVFEAWANDGHPYRFLGESAYALVDLETDGEGWPDAFGWPPALSRSLFRHSRLYEALTLRMAPRTASSDPTTAEVAERIAREIVAPAHAVGAQVVVVTAVALDRPLSGPPADFEVAAQRVAERDGAAFVSLRELLADQPVDRIRLDTCCHFKESTNDLIARRLAPLVARVLADRSVRGNLLRTAGR